jgi:hypothetical protein
MSVDLDTVTADDGRDSARGSQHHVGNDRGILARQREGTGQSHQIMTNVVEAGVTFGQKSLREGRGFLDRARRPRVEANPQGSHPPLSSTRQGKTTPIPCTKHDTRVVIVAETRSPRPPCHDLLPRQYELSRPDFSGGSQLTP